MTMMMMMRAMTVKCFSVLCFENKKGWNDMIWDLIKKGLGSEEKKEGRSKVKRRTKKKKIREQSDDRLC